MFLDVFKIVDPNMGIQPMQLNAYNRSYAQHFVFVFFSSTLSDSGANKIEINLLLNSILLVSMRVFYGCNICKFG